MYTAIIIMTAANFKAHALSTIVNKYNISLYHNTRLVHSIPPNYKYTTVINKTFVR